MCDSSGITDESLIMAHVLNRPIKDTQRSKEDKILDILIKQRLRTLARVKNVTMSFLSEELGIPVVRLNATGHLDSSTLIKLIMFLEIDPNTFFRPVIKTISYYRKNKMVAKIPYHEVNVRDELL